MEGKFSPPGGRQDFISSDGALSEFIATLSARLARVHKCVTCDTSPSLKIISERENGPHKHIQKQAVLTGTLDQKSKIITSMPKKKHTIME